jgi:hypothetical protein
VAGARAMPTSYLDPRKMDPLQDSTSKAQSSTEVPL